MSEVKKKPTRRSVKKDTDKARAKKVKKDQAKAKGQEAKRGTLSPEKATVENSATSKRKHKAGRKNRGDTSTKLRWPQMVLVLFLLVLVTLAGLFAWDRWFRYDDASDIQGEWVFTSEESSVLVDVNADRITFSSDIHFPYKIDAWGKTIIFSFSDLSGKGVYRFSLDRKTVYISEDATEDIFVSIQVSLGLKDPSEGFDLAKTTILTKQDAQSLPLADDDTSTEGESEEGASMDETQADAATESQDGEALGSEDLNDSGIEDNTSNEE